MRVTALCQPQIPQAIPPPIPTSANSAGCAPCGPGATLQALRTVATPEPHPPRGTPFGPACACIRLHTIPLNQLSPSFNSVAIPTNLNKLSYFFRCFPGPSYASNGPQPRYFHLAAPYPLPTANTPACVSKTKWGLYFTNSSAIFGLQSQPVPTGGNRIQGMVSKNTGWYKTVSFGYPQFIGSPMFYHTASSARRSAFMRRCASCIAATLASTNLISCLRISSLLNTSACSRLRSRRFLELLMVQAMASRPLGPGYRRRSHCLED